MLLDCLHVDISEQGNISPLHTTALVRPNLPAT